MAALRDRRPAGGLRQSAPRTPPRTRPEVGLKGWSGPPSSLAPGSAAGPELLPGARVALDLPRLHRRRVVVVRQPERQLVAEERPNGPARAARSHLDGVRDRRVSATKRRAGPWPKVKPFSVDARGLCEEASTAEKPPSVATPGRPAPRSVSPPPGGSEKAGPSGCANVIQASSGSRRGWSSRRRPARRPGSRRGRARSEPRRAHAARPDPGRRRRGSRRRRRRSSRAAAATPSSPCHRRG